MKNPLFVIQGNLQMMEMGMGESMPPVVKKYLGRIDRSTQNLLRMVLNLIDVFKIEDGTMELKKELASLNEVIEKSYMKIWDYPENENKKVITHFAQDLPLTQVDTSVMERVFDNLIGFGLANVDKEGRLEVETHHDDETIYFSIHDFGNHIPTKYSESVFDKFSQVEIKNEGYRLGRGLALTFCKLAVEAHNGQLAVDTENSVGNRFILSLPVRKRG